MGTQEIECTEMLTLEHWVKPNTLPFLWKALARELDTGKTYDECVRQLQGFFRAGKGSPTGRQLREIVNRMVQKKEAPREFLSAWDRRRGRERQIPGLELAPRFGKVADDWDRPREDASTPHVEPTKVDETPTNVVAIERTDVVDWWPLAVVQGEPRPLMEDEELARRLGYDRPRTIRDLIGRIFNDSDIRRIVRQNPGRGRPATVFLLTRIQALKVVMRSETPQADAMQDKIIAVYEAWLDQQRPASPAIDLSRLDAFLAKVEKRDGSLATTLDRIESRLAARDALLATALGQIESEVIALKAQATTMVSEPRGRDVKSRVEPIPEGWLSHRAVAAKHGLPSVGPTASIVARICEAAGFDKDPALLCVARTGGFKTIALSPECVRRLEPALAAARQTMRDYGYQLGAKKKMDARPEVRPMFGATRVLDEMLASARERISSAA